MSEISIVTPSFNQAPFIGQALKSVKQQPTHIQHIVLDGGSTDGSQQIIEEYSSDLYFWRSRPDEGQSAAINEGLSVASGDILSWINSDDALAPNASVAMLQAMGDQTGPSWAIGQCHVINADGKEIGFWRPSENCTLQDIVRLSKKSLMQPAIFWNRQMQDKAGLLQCDLHYVMDFDLWLRFFRIQAPVIVNQPIGVHRVHALTKTSLVGCEVCDERARVLRNRLSEEKSLMRAGLKDVASKAARSANASMYGLNRYRCMKFMRSALSADVGAVFNSDFQKAAVKLVNPLQRNKSLN